MAVGTELKSIEQEWLGFLAMVFSGVDPSDVQVEEMKRAFFAGYYAKASDFIAT